MIKAVIFDMDGLLIDSEPLWDEVDTVLLKRRGHKISKELLHQRLGIGQHATAELFKKKFKLSEDITKLLSERQEIFSEIFDKNPKLMPGVEYLVKRFAAKKLKLAIATGGHTVERVEKFLHHFALNNYITSITTSHEVKKGKPAPDIFLLAADKLKVDPSSCLVFEDAPSGVQAGISAAMIVFGVNPDTKLQDKLKKSQANEVFSSLIEASTALKNYNI